MPITGDYIVDKIRKLVKQCYEEDQFHQFEIDPRSLKDAGVIKITIMGIPEENAIEIQNKIMKM